MTNRYKMNIYDSNNFMSLCSYIVTKKGKPIQNVRVKAYPRKEQMKEK
jgi:hypothetical protein